MLREEGARALWFKTLGEICYRRLVIMEFPLEQTIPTFPIDGPASIDFLDPLEIDEYLSFQRQDRREQISARFAAGHRCFAARIDGQLAGVTWCALGDARIEFLGVAFPLAPGEAFGFGTYTHPSFRARGVASGIRSQLLSTLKREGLQRCFGAVMPENRGGMRVAEKLGYRPIGIVGAVWFGGHRQRRRVIRMKRGELAPGSENQRSRSGR